MKTNFRLRNVLVLIASLALVAGFSACSDDDDEYPSTMMPTDSTTHTDNGESTTGATETTTTDAGATGDVRIVHGAYDAPAVDVWVNDEPPMEGGALEAIAFGEATGYIALPVGEYDFDIAATGTDDIVASINAEVTEGLSATALAYGSVAAETFDTSILVDDISDPGDGNFRLTFFHGATAVGPVDIYAGGDAIIEDADLGQSATLDPLPAAAYDLDVHEANEDSPLLSFLAPLEDAFGAVLAVAVGSTSGEESSVQLLAVFQNGDSLLLDPLME